MFFGAAAELDHDAIAAAATGSSTDPRWKPEESAVLQLADALHDHGDVDDDLHAVLAEHFDAAQRIELVFLCGLYHAVSFVCRTFALDPEPGTEPWTPLTSPPKQHPPH